MPVPENKQHYIQVNENDNYFAIEHYFPDTFLKEEKMLEPTAIENIYKIKDKSGKKTKFAKSLVKKNDLHLFKGFICLFKEIVHMEDFQA